MQISKHLDHEENAVCKAYKEILQGSMAEDSKTVGSIFGSRKKIDAVKKRVRRIGPTTVQFDSVTATTSDGGIHR